MDAINFDISISQQTSGSCHCALRYEPLGDADGPLQVDLEPGPLPTLLSWAASSINEGSANLDSAQELGHQLYQLLFHGELGEFLRSALQDAEDAGAPLRLRLSTRDLTLMSLPWEFLYDRRRDRLFAVDRDTPLVRYLSDYATFGRPRPLAATLPLRLLMVVPAVPDLDVQGEIARVQAALQKGKLLGQQVELVALGGADGPVTVEGLRDFLQEDGQGFDILHFSGHGDTKGGRGNIRFDDAAGGEKWVAGGTFARTLKPYASPQRPRPLRLVVLNCCEGGISAPRAYGVRTLLGLAPALIQHGVPAVVAMQYQVLDAAALAFARAFYRALVLGDTAGRVDAAVTDARQALESQFEGHRSFATPVLFLRAARGVLFEVGER